MGSYWRLLSYLKRYKFHLLASIICMIIASAATLFIPWCVKNFIRDALLNHDLARLNLILTFSLVVITLLALAEYGYRMLMNYVGQKVILQLRNELFDHLMGLSLRFYKDYPRGALISKLTNDVALLQNFILSGVLKLLKEPLTIIGAIILLFHLHWRLTLLTFVVAPIIVTVIINFGKRMKKVTATAQQKLAETTAILEESICGIKVINLFTMEERKRREFSDSNKGYFDYYLKSLGLSSASGPVIEMLSTLGIIIVLWYGGYEVVSGRIAPEELIAFVLYLGTVSGPIKQLASINLFIQQAEVASNRLFTLLDTKDKILEDPSARPLPPIKGEIEFRDLSFAYDKKAVIKGVNLKIKQGEVLAIVGPSGAGKTTIINLLCRFYDLTDGVIEIDGYDIRKVILKSLRDQLGVVSQEIILFRGTVVENIRCGRPEASMEEVKSSAEIANAAEFILALEEGYQTEIGEGGARLSGGQKQRLAIARAILRNPAILIMDEATSSLDTESETLIQQALSKIMHNQTTIIIAHRLSTVISADRIVVMDNGEIVEICTHSELLSKGGLYTKLYDRQFDFS